MTDKKSKHIEKRVQKLNSQKRAQNRLNKILKEWYQC